jgi:hypothetical protein
MLPLVVASVALALASYAHAARETHMVPMRDGVSLATDVALPQGEGPWPALLARTPYDKKAIPLELIAAQGYAAVAQDVRGRFASQGLPMAFLDDGWGERQDGYDTVEWVAAQPWCNAKVGTFGPSALGITQNMMAGAAPPHLVCQHVAVACSDVYGQAVFQGGAFRKALVEGWLGGNQWPDENLKLMTAHPHYDELWAMLSPESRHAHVTVPTYQLGGWYDIFSQGNIDSFVGLQTRGGEGARGRQKLVMGPWTHGGMTKREQGDLTYPANCTSRGGLVDMKRWVDHWLKGIDTGMMKEPPVTYYVMGDVDDPAAPGNEWRTASAWPVPARETPYYLRSDGRLTTEPPAGDEAPHSYTYDPNNPVPTVGGANLLLPAGPMDQRLTEERPDVLCFSTPPLTRPLEATGRISVRLYAASSGRDTDFTAKLSDVYPDGRSMLLLDGIIRARHRNSVRTEELLQPGQVYEFGIDLWSTSIVFNAGHRVRVAISSSNAPRFDPNPNTGEPFRASDRTIAATNTIYHDAAHASALLLPVVEASQGDA